MSHASWLTCAVKPQNMRLAAGWIVEECLKNKITAIACRGVSGITIASVVSYVMQIPLIIVRKPNEDRHSACICEYDEIIKEQKNCRIAIIDDLISSGNTIKEIVFQLNREKLPKPFRVILYRHSVYKKPETVCRIKIIYPSEDFE